MSAENDHNKLICKAAGSVLKKDGLFQKGSSRTWIDDNGWFWIVVEFQPSNWAKGSYLNVAVHYLWSGQDYISFDFGSREKAFLPFSGDAESFYTEMLSLAEYAAEKVTAYRDFQDTALAKEWILQRNGFASASVELYHKMMICGLTRDTRAKRLASQLLQEIQYSQRDYDVQYRKELTENILPIMDKPPALEQYIQTKILKQRAFWRSKSSMKKLKPDAEFSFFSK